MSKRLLAPVPCKHLAAALQLNTERVAFGSNMVELFSHLPEKTPVLIYASLRTAGEEHLYVPATATFAATFLEWVPPNLRGEHKFPEERPVSTRNDTAFRGFWVVNEFRRLQEKNWVPFSALKKPGSPAPLTIKYPLGPMIVVEI
jgi:hypothetical protein